MTPAGPPVSRGARVPRPGALALPRVLTALLVASALLLPGCGHRTGDTLRITIWHQDRIDVRVVLEKQIGRFMALHPGVKVEQLFKETEELRSGFIIAALAGQGPDIVYGPSDQVGPFETMQIILPLEGIFDSAWCASYDPLAMTWYKGHLYQVADKLGNHLTLVYNRKLVPLPPATDLEMIAIGKQLTAPPRGGKGARYGLAWNYTEPFFFIPFLTGFGGWIMDGASWHHKLRHITVPLIRPVMVPAITLGTIWTFNNLNIVWLVSNAGEPSDQTHLLVSFVYKAAFNFYRYGYGAALSVVIFLILLAFSLTFMRTSKAAENVYG